MGRGDARSFSLTRGLSSAAWLRSRTRSRSRSRSRSSLRFSAVRGVLAEDWASFFRIFAAAAVSEVDRDSCVGGGAIGGRGFAEPDGSGAERLLSRASTGPDFFGGGGRGESARRSVPGGVADGLTLKPEPGNLRIDGLVADVGVPAALLSSTSRFLAFALALAPSSFEGIAISAGLLRVPSPLLFFVAFFVMTTPFFSGAGALGPEPDAAPEVGRGRTLSQIGSDSGIFIALNASRARRDKVNRSSAVRLAKVYGRTSRHDSRSSCHSCDPLVSPFFTGTGSAIYSYRSHFSRDSPLTGLYTVATHLPYKGLVFSSLLFCMIPSTTIHHDVRHGPWLESEPVYHAFSSVLIYHRRG